MIDSADKDLTKQRLGSIFLVIMYSIAFFCFLTVSIMVFGVLFTYSIMVLTEDMGIDAAAATISTVLIFALLATMTWAVWPIVRSAFISIWLRVTDKG